MAISLFGYFLSNLLSFAVCFIYPAYLTFSMVLTTKYSPCGKKDIGKKIEEKAKELKSNVMTTTTQNKLGLVSNEEINDYIHYGLYWIIFVFYTCIETGCFFSLIQYIPCYYEMKSILFFWLGSEHFKGAGWLWFSIIETNYKFIDNILVDAFDAYCPQTIKQHLVCTNILEDMQRNEFNASRNVNTPINENTFNKNK